MAGCQSDTRTLMTLTELYLPAIHEHFVRCSVMAEVAFVSWFLCLFFNVLPAETALRVWDCMFGVLANQQASAPINVVFTEADKKLGLTFPAGVSPLVVYCFDCNGPETPRAQARTVRNYCARPAGERPNVRRNENTHTKCRPAAITDVCRHESDRGRAQRGGSCGARLVVARRASDARLVLATNSCVVGPTRVEPGH